MSLLNHPLYSSPDLIQSLKDHGLVHDRHSQLADAFRAGFVAGKKQPWPNNCNKSVPEALRFLANNERPVGGEQRFNSSHLLQLANEIESFYKAQHG
jgi:hypothetical protein